MRQIFFDTETTGLEAAGGDRILEIGCVEMINRQLTGRYLHLYINPERASHEDALAVHGITEAFLADKPKFAQIVDEFIEFVADSELVIHNAPFDLGFVNAEMKRLGRPPINDVVSGVRDTLLMAREMFPGKKNSLDALCSRLDVDNSKRELHGAHIDAELLAQVYINMTRGQDSLVIDDSAGEGASAGGEIRVAAVDLSRYALPVLQASETELAAHAKVMGELDKASGGKRIWQEETQVS
ncbi:DNA polymerase III subunit epsilon [Paucibacter sp. R3-3]|uniref:DNA polymerase III subunit epsilon n=1 Tax=Roseateles agri TaxID=3098619 RepID=A0ABU5DIH3_9BURK|nr:DNA polymerase III subunit epsilon [Paucibacter sp. R3-3]MDY0746090.1 DNA polymerase III subunit epsilon [Paucibacter sp. R3-3]